MATRKGIPPSLEPYLRLPPELSLLLVTGTMGCSPTWLTARFVGSILGHQDDISSTPTAVLFVSWMQCESFWKNEIRRTTSLDVSKVHTRDRFIFVDCLSTAISDKPDSLEQLSTTLSAAAQKLSPHRVILILDNPALLLATTSTTAQSLNQTILKLRSQVHGTILTASADEPFLSAAQTASFTSDHHTPLESETASFIAQQAHSALFVINCRELATGAAKDVSGVLRVTRGGEAYTYSSDSGDNASGVTEMEALYLVNRDGSARVFERGSD